MVSKLFLTLALVATPVSPAAAQDKFELPLSSLVAHSESTPKLSLGSVGLDSKAGNSHVWSGEVDRYYFNIPSEHSFKKVSRAADTNSAWGQRLALGCRWRSTMAQRGRSALRSQR